MCTIITVVCNCTCVQLLLWLLLSGIIPMVTKSSHPLTLSLFNKKLQSHNRIVLSNYSLLPEDLVKSFEPSCAAPWPSWPGISFKFLSFVLDNFMISWQEKISKISRCWSLIWCKKTQFLLEILCFILQFLTKFLSKILPYWREQHLLHDMKYTRF